MAKLAEENALGDDGFPYTYHWTDEPNKVYKPHSHKGNVAFYVLKGDITTIFSDGTNITTRQGERLDVPTGVKHWAIVGSEGCVYVVGEEIEGDS